MKSEIKLALVGVAGAILLYGGWAAYRAHRCLVTLEVRDMPVRQVVKKMQWQTWETIVVHSNVQGKVTLNVRKVPLEEVFKIIDDQLSCNHSMLYPLYSKGSALVSLKKALRGEVDPMSYGWTNLQARGFFGFGGRGGGGPGGFGGFGGGPGGGPMGMGGGAPAGDGLISLDIQNKDVAFATLAFGRFGGTRVVPEDGANSLPITLKLEKATVDDAVSKLAKKAHRSYARLYVMRGEMQFGRGGRDGGGRGGPPDFAQRDGATNMDRRMFRGPEMTDEQREQIREQRMLQETQLLAALPAEDRQKIEQAQQQRQETFQQMQNMAPEERQQFMEQRFGAQGGAMMQQRGVSRIRNTTPEQRGERTARRREFDYMRFQGIQPQGRPPGGGGGRPGGGGGGGGGGRPGR